MAIYKPSWLRNWLSRLNWDIFTWKIYIGDAIEDGIDWLIDWLNNAIEWGEAAWNKAVDAWYKAVELARDLLATINREVSRIWANIGTWWSDLSEWWLTRVTMIKDWIDAALSPIRSLLPNLLDITWWRSFWGGALANISDWWGPEKRKLRDEIDAEVDPVRDEVNKHTTWFDMIKDLFTDPEKWLLDMIERMLSRFI